jgi:lipoprotein-releasing system ATP-binding protein
MSDDLERLLKESAGGGVSPRLRLTPRVRGGPLLAGAPRLEDGLQRQEDGELPANGKPVHGPPPREHIRVDGPHSLFVGSRREGAASNGETHHVEDDQDHPTPPAATGQLVARNLHKSYRKASVEIPVLNGASLHVEKGELLAIVGKSGSGKSTLLHLLGTLDAPDSGQVFFDGQRIDDLPARYRDSLRNRYFGMIFQFYHLLPELTTLENVLAPLMIGDSVLGYWRRRREYRQLAGRMLELVGLGHRMKHKPRELSGGEMQRAAIARSLVNDPELLLADEPTGNLDVASGREVLDLLASLNRQRNLTIVMVTHDQAIADMADRVVRLTNGRVEEA